MKTILPATLILVALTGPAQAQTSKPTQAKQAKLAGEWIAQALVTARQNKQLGRFLTKRTFYAPGGRNPMLISTEGETSAKGIEVRIHWEYVGISDKVDLTYRFGAQGLLREVITQTGTSGWRMVISGAKIRTTRLRRGRVRRGSAAVRGRAQEAPFSQEVVPITFAMFVLPSLHDQGLPQELRCSLGKAKRLGSTRRMWGVIRRTTKPTRQPKLGLVHTVTLAFDRRGEFARALVAADGKQKGQLLRLTVQEGGPMHFERLSAAALKKLLERKPILTNETHAINSLKSIATAQTTYAQRKKGATFADSLDELVKSRHAYVLFHIKDGTDSGYMFFVRRSADAPSKRWMAIAVPVTPGKTGKRYFVVNHDHQVYASDTKLELNDACSIPKGLKQLP